MAILSEWTSSNSYAQRNAYAETESATEAAPQSAAPALVPANT